MKFCIDSLCLKEIGREIRVGERHVHMPGQSFENYGICFVLLYV